MDILVWCFFLGFLIFFYVWCVIDYELKKGWWCLEVKQYWFVLYGSKDENFIDVNC